MSALELFRSFNETLTRSEREMLKSRIKAQWEDLTAARSEEARTRLVHEYIHEVRTLTQQPAK